MLLFYIIIIIKKGSQHFTAEFRLGSLYMALHIWNIIYTSLFFIIPRILLTHSLLT
jgi:hypothetical protein